MHNEVIKAISIKVWSVPIIAMFVLHISTSGRDDSVLGDCCIVETSVEVTEYDICISLIMHYFSTIKITFL